MESITVFTANVEESRVLKAFLEALKMSYIQTPTATLAELESRLLPKQRQLWDNLKNSISDVENGTAEATSWADFKKELANDH